MQQWNEDNRSLLEDLDRLSTSLFLYYFDKLQQDHVKKGTNLFVKFYLSLYSLFIFNSQRERELTLKSLCHTTPQETYKHLYSSMIHHRCKNIPYYYHTFLLPPLSVLVLGLRDVLFIRLLDSWTDLV